MALTEQEKQIVEYGKQQGKSVQEVQSALLRFRAGITTPQLERRPIIEQKKREAELAETEAEKAQSFLGQTKAFGKELGEISGVLPTGRRIAAGIAPLVTPREELPTVIESLVGGITEPKKMGAIGTQLKDLGVPENIAEGIDIAIDLPLISLGLSKSISKLITEGGIKAMPKVIALLDKSLLEFAPEAVKKLAQIDISTPIKEQAEKIIKPIKAGIEKIKGLHPYEIIGKTKNYLSRKGIPENFEESIKRLTVKGEEEITQKIPITIKGKPLAQEAIEGTKMKNPIKLYNEFYEQELKFKKDIKQDTAIGIVGEKIGNAYEKVIGLRRKAGKEMADEMLKLGKTKMDITDSFPKLEQELFDSGATFDLKKKTVQLSPQSKITSQDKNLIQTYVIELNKLGTNPSAGELDAFLSRIPKEIDVFKSKNNVTQVTNGERIISSHLRELREVFNPSKNPVFKVYYDAKSDYAELTRFLDEGAGFLGKKTQTGDFAKDASIAKSAVQSILNQGKKDWLLTLEDLTGYQALDESVVALKAMSDAGNFRGESLLNLLTQEKIPKSQRQLTERIIEKVADFIADKFVGSEKEQTIRIMNDILLKKK